MDTNAKYFDANRRVWDELTHVHLRGSSCYQIEEFKKGACALRQLERDEVGDVSGKSLLHLQCHFGMDTLSWARRGARVTGVDLSEEAIRAARSLAQETRIEAEFICCNVYDLREHLQGQFDIVYASYGVLYWLPDLREWARIIAHFLKDGGFFYIADGHPIFDDCIQEEGGIARLEGDYFATGQACYGGTGPDYANPEYSQVNPEYYWRHTLGDVVNSLIDAGLRIAFLHEFPNFGREPGPDGVWRAPEKPAPYPKMFSLKALKDSK